jgi:peroxiredoxin
VRVPPEVGSLALPPSPRAGFPAPDFALSSLGGETVALAELRGSVVLVNIWASWCGPCRAEMPAIQRLYEADADRGLQILAVNSTVQDSAADARAFADELGLSFPILLDVDGAVTRAYRVQALPSTFIIGRDGVVRRVLYGGPLSEATLRAELEPLLQEAP